MLSFNGYSYSLDAEIEGFEYIVTNRAYTKFKHELEKINKYDVDLNIAFKKYCPNKKITTIDTRVLKANKKRESKYLLIEENTIFIVNKYSTSKNLEIIDMMNKTAF